MKKSKKSKIVETVTRLYHVYTHPCSTCVLYYVIPDIFINKIKEDEKYKIGMYRTYLNEYINKFYPVDHFMKGEPYIRDHGKIELTLPDCAEKPYNKIKDLDNDLFYYEFSYEDMEKLHKKFPELKEKMNKMINERDLN